MPPQIAVAPGVRRLAIPLPIAALRVVNCYLVEGERGWALVDSGLHTVEAEQALRSGLREAGVELADVRRTFITHVHPDHIGMAGLMENAGSEIVMHGPEAKHARRLWASGTDLIDQAYAWFSKHGMPHDVDDEMRKAWLAMGRRVDPIERIEEVADAEQLDLGGRAVRVRWTPGHTDHHAVLIDEVNRTLFAGDHVLPTITSNISLYPWSREDPLGDFMDALRAMRDLPVHRVLPAHGEPFEDLRGRVDALIEHHEHRLNAVIEALGREEVDAYVVCRRIFPVLRNAHEERFALAETLAHLRHLEKRGRVRETVSDGHARWTSA